MSSGLEPVATWLGRLRGDGSLQARRLREWLVAAGILFLTGWIGLTIADRYSTVFIVFTAVLVVILMIENQERTLYLLLWFSTVYTILKATVLGWSKLAFLFKEGFLALLVAFWVFHLVLRQDRLPDTPLNKPLAALLGWLGIQCFNPNNFGLLSTLDDLRQWLGQIAVFFLTVHLLRDVRSIERGLKVVFGYAVVAMAYGLVQPLLPRDLLVRLGADPTSYFYFHDGTVRSFSTMGTVPFAMFAMLFPPIAFYFARVQRNVLHGWAFALLGFGFVAAAVLTLVRTAWVAMAIGTALYLLVGRRWVLLSLFAGAGIAVALFASGYMATKVAGLLNPGEDPSIQTRLLIARIVTEAVIFRVFGYGLGTFAHSKWAVDSAGKVGLATSTENWYLMVSLELGWIGIGILLWIWYKLYRVVWTAWQGGLADPRWRELALALGASCFTLEVARLGGPAGYYPPDSWHYWFFAGILMNLGRLDAGQPDRAPEREGPPVAAGAAPLAAGP